MKTIEELGISSSPWKVDEDGVVESAISKDNFTDIVHDWPYPNDRYSPCHNANARLIAAAPELYEALRKLLIVANNRMPSQPTVDEAELLMEAEAALAKAGGEVAK